jgi:hypothetical protein
MDRNRVRGKNKILGKGSLGDQILIPRRNQSGTAQWVTRFPKKDLRSEFLRSSPGFQVLGKDLISPAFNGGGNNQGVPEGNPVLLLDFGGPSDGSGAIDDYRPVNIILNEPPGFDRGQGVGDLAGDIHIKFLDNLRTQDTGFRLPELPQQVGRRLMLLPGIQIMGIDQDVGIDKNFNAHEVFPGKERGRRNEPLF